MAETMRKKWRGFGKTLDVKTGRWRAWYVDKDGNRRWSDTEELVDKGKGLCA